MARLVFLVTLFFASSTYAQVRVTGRVTDAASGEGLAQASLILEGTDSGTSTDKNGNYTLAGLPLGTYTLTVSYVGYLSASRVITLRSSNLVIDFKIETTSISLEATEVFASRATDRRTPVAYSNVDRLRVQRELGPRDLPLVLNRIPSVYSTAQGGGAGDARVNVRGFNQRNVSILINGIPINDMENGWVYWSNWSDIHELTNSIQMQRGLSVVNLATPSIGGTINIITDPAQDSRQILVKQELGSDRYIRSTVLLSSGLIDNKFAVTLSGSRKTGDGTVDGTWTDLWWYYAAASWNISSWHRLNLIAFGTPQRHGQNLFRQNLAAYDHDFATKLFKRDGLTDHTISDILRTFPEMGRHWNQNIAAVSSDYTRIQHNGFGTVRRKRDGYINETENFFHKPIASLSYFGQLAERTLLSTVLYYSGGKGGGTSLHGTLLLDESGPSPIPDYDATIRVNQKNGFSHGIVRNRHNVQWTFGAISKLAHDVGEHLNIEAGIDWRTAEMQHFSTVRDLLGGHGYLRFDNDFWGDNGKVLVLGDRFEYNDITTVNWIGGFLQGKLDWGRFEGFGVVGYSTVKYTLEDFFKDNGTGQPFTAAPPSIGAYQAKGGLSYSVSEDLSVFVNAGRVSKAPVYDGVIDAITGAVNPDPQNEVFLGFEAGGIYSFPGRTFETKLNVYHTVWKDRTVTRNLLEESGNNTLVSIHGLNALHRGIEGELAWQPLNIFRIDLAYSAGDWTYTDDVTGTLTLDRSNEDTQSELSLPLKGVKIGNAPQQQLTYTVALFPQEGLNILLMGRSYTNHYAGFNPSGFTGGAIWKAPGYTVFDFKAGYDFDFYRYGIALFVNVFNVTDALYVQDAINNSQLHAYTGNGTEAGTADDAEVFLGLPRTFYVGTRITFR